MDRVRDAAEIEVLELGGPTGGRGRQRLWRQVALVALALVILLAAGEMTRRWVQATAPEFSREEIAEVYTAPLSANSGTLNWDPSTLLIQDGGEDVTTPGIEPAECAGIVNADDPPVSDDLVSVNLAPVVRPDGGQLFSGTVLTYRYGALADARAKFSAIRDGLARCATFGDIDTRFSVDQVIVTDLSRARSDLSFRLDDTDTSLRVTLIRFGNTVTWVTTAAGVDATSLDHGDFPDLLVDRMESVHHAR